MRTSTGRTPARGEAKCQYCTGARRQERVEAPVEPYHALPCPCPKYTSCRSIPLTVPAFTCIPVPRLRNRALGVRSIIQENCAKFPRKSRLRSRLLRNSREQSLIQTKPIHMVDAIKVSTYVTRTLTLALTLTPCIECDDIVSDSLRHQVHVYQVEPSFLCCFSNPAA